MTKKQINAAIQELLTQADKHIKSAAVMNSEHSQSSWIAHMAASLVCSSLTAALIEAHRATEDEHHYHDTNQTGLQQL